MADADADLNERFEQHLTIAADPRVVFDCFFNPEALRAWWQAVRSVTTPVPLGVYAVEWARTPYTDDLLGPLGGVFHGTVVDVRPGQGFLVADAWWVPPEGDPVGPMAQAALTVLAGLLLIVALILALFGAFGRTTA